MIESMELGIITSLGTDGLARVGELSSPLNCGRVSMNDPA